MRKVLVAALIFLMHPCATTNGTSLAKVPEPPVCVQSKEVVVDSLEQKSELKTPDKKLSEKEKERMKKELLSFGVDSVFLDSLFARGDFGIYDVQKLKKLKTYEEYRKALKIDEKIEHGVEFVKENLEMLEKLEKEFGISKYYISATLGIETDYGRHIGEYNAIYALLTMYYRAGTWKGKRRWAKEMIDFLRMCEELNLDPFNVPSSWAGAIGPGQWMPLTWRRSFKDWNGNGRRDPFDLEDVLYNIAAHYARYKSVEKAIFAYNPSHMYVRATNEIADGIKKSF
jgi:membrane-bound lytic murein transglycosylase B